MITLRPENSEKLMGSIAHNMRRMFLSTPRKKWITIIIFLLPIDKRFFFFSCRVFKYIFSKVREEMTVLAKSSVKNDQKMCL